MKLRRRGIFVSALALIALTLALTLSREHEPSYNGRSLSAWLNLYTKPAQFDQRGSADEHQAAEAVRHIGTNALPCLLRWVRYEPSGLQRRFNLVAQQLPRRVQNNSLMQELFTSRAAGRSFAALAGFSILGPTASQAVPELTIIAKTTNHPFASCQAIYALAPLGKDALPPLLDALRNPRMPHRNAAAASIGFMGYLGTNANPAVPVLADCLRDSDSSVAEAAAIALGNLTLEPKLAVPALTDALQHSNANVRFFSVNAIAKYRAEATHATNALLKTLSDTDPTVRQAATNALQSIALPAH